MKSHFEPSLAVSGFAIPLDTPNAGLYVAFKHSISFATDLAVQTLVATNPEIVPEIVSKPFRASP